MFSFFLANNLLAPNQTGFKPGDSCLNQLLSITHEIYLKLEVSSWIYLKPLIKFCMKALYLNLSKMVFRLACLTSYLIFCQSSSWTNVNVGVPQGFILGPLLFLIYINNLSDNLSSNAKLFDDDTSLFSVVHDINTSAIELNSDLKKNKWFGLSMENDSQSRS